MPNTANRPLKIFPCHDSADKSAVHKLYRYLREVESDKMIALLDEVDHIFGRVAIPQVEMAATFQRAVRMEVASAKLAAKVWEDFLDYWQSFTRQRILREQ